MTMMTDVSVKIEGLTVHMQNIIENNKEDKLEVQKDMDAINNKFDVCQKEVQDVKLMFANMKGMLDEYIREHSDKATINIDKSGDDTVINVNQDK